MNTSSAFRPTKPRRVDTPKGAVSEQFAQVGGVKMVMNRLGIGQSQTYAYTDPQSEEEISFFRMVALTSRPQRRVPSSCALWPAASSCP
ncbi:hypothetical protein [Reyranella sp.]|jgi:hypothetical protein|uniref:hypothetical protein n=1 Tax=Reyranella sp. TaxID=1929291 RepID=UPI00260DEFD2|nr:hypothetical protein [Reyranella sp.]HQT15758.1 hypothetical protein [Reyranella sp.]